MAILRRPRRRTSGSRSSRRTGSRRHSPADRFMGVRHPPGRMQQPVKHGSPCSASGSRPVSQALACETAAPPPATHICSAMGGNAAALSPLTPVAVPLRSNPWTRQQHKSRSRAESDQAGKALRPSAPGLALRSFASSSRDRGPLPAAQSHDQASGSRSRRGSQYFWKARRGSPLHSASAPQASGRGCR